ncbi:hypothetical protein SSX86_021511 [Deinandra increscens subsp. villosa]|uniref:Pectinesterase inhibitor domain-containing protein n=1 Tax=Deinandra increscens subsp. villosa TaxID=3103831 RepID=A0AAP0CPW9_9ASTR
MALAKKTLAIILIFAYIIFTTCTNAQSKPAKPAGKSSKPATKLPVPHTKRTTPKGKAPKGNAEVASMVAKQMQGVRKKIDEFNASLKKRLNNPKSPPRTRECVSQCDEVFGAAIDDIKKTLDSLKSQNLVKANFDVSAVATNVDTCADCFNDMGKGGDAEVKKLCDWVRKITGDALVALQKAAAHKSSKPATKPPVPHTKRTAPKGKAEVANMVAKQMQGVRKKINEFNASLKKRLNHPKSPPRTRECVSQCDEVFGAAIDDIKKTLNSLKSQNLMKANFDVSAVATNVDTCADCFDDMGKGGDAEVKKLCDWVRKITGDALAALQKAA